MSMLQAPNNVSKTVVIVMTLAGSGAMLYYGYTKLKSKKRTGPPTSPSRTTARKPVEDVSKEPLEGPRSDDPASQECAPSTDRTEESIVEESSRPTCEVKLGQKLKVETDLMPLLDPSAVTPPLSDSSFERVYLSKPHVDEPSNSQPESMGESFEAISMSQVSSALSLQKFDAADVDVSPAGSSDSQPRSPFESPDKLLVESVDPQTSLQSSAYEKLSLSQFQSTSDDDKSGDSEGGASAQSEGVQVLEGEVSATSSVQDVQSVLGAPESHHDV